AKTCLLMPGAIRDLKSVLKLADQAVTGTQKHGDYRWFLLARGMADYRADQYADAIDRMKKVLLPGAEDLYRDPMADLFLAMAHHQRGQADESRKALDKARALMAQRFPKPDKEGLGNNWDDWLRCQIVLREVEALLEQKRDRTSPERAK